MARDLFDSDPFDRLDRRLGIGAGRTKKRGLSPEEEQSLLGSIGHGIGSGLEKLGNVLDTPGAAVRNLLTGKNPLPGVFDPSERTSGRQMLEQAGVLGPNQEGLDVGDVAGLAAEIATDPLTYLTLGGSAATKLGKAVKSAGLAKNLSRTQKLKTTVGKVLSTSTPEQVESFVRAAPDASYLRKAALDEPLTQHGRFHIPGLVDTTFDYPGGARVAGAVEKIGDVLTKGKIPGTNFSPGRALAANFSARAMGTTSELGQEFAPKAFERKQALKEAARKQAFGHAQQLEDLGPNAPDPVALRRMLENVEPAAPNVAGMVSEEQAALDAMEKAERRIGASTMRRENYFPRQATTSVVGGPGSNRTFSTADASRIRRESFLTDLPEATSTIQTVAKNPLIRQAVENGVDDKGVAFLIQQQFGDPTKPFHVPATYEKAVKGGTVKQGNRYLAMAKMLKQATPEQLEAGFFGNHPVFDFQTRGVRHADKMASGQTVLEALAAHAQPVAGPTKGMTTVKDVLRRLDLDTGIGGIPKEALHTINPQDADGALFEIARQRGLPHVTREMLDEVVPQSLADDLVKFRDKFDNPAALNPFIKAMDSFTSLFKAGVLTRPSRYTRDLTSGQFQNWVHDMFSLGSLKNAWQIVRGDVPTGLSKNAHIAQLLAAEGLPATDEAAKDLIQRIAYSNRLTSPASITSAQIGGAGTAPVASSLQGMLGEAPGAIPFSWKTVGRKAAGREPGTTLNPFDVQGVMDLKGVPRQESAFGPLAAGNDVGALTDGLNRVAPLIHQLEAGVSPSEAVARIKAAQIDYASDALTQTERTILTRLFPFYRFTKGIVPATLKELWERPGGKLGQTLRASRIGHTKDELVPENIQQGAAIPLPTEPGTPKAFITGLGLMHEDPLAFLGNGLQGVGLEALSRSNPLLKATIEGATGHSLFQRGPLGGRPLEDLDPLLGRTAANLVGSDEPLHYPAERIIEPLLANSPLSNIAGTARRFSELAARPGTESYERRSVPVTAANFLTGLRVTKVPKKVERAILRERAQKTIRALPGSKSFTDLYLPDEAIAALPPHLQEEALRAKAALNVLARQGREEKKAKEKAASQ